MTSTDELASELASLESCCMHDPQWHAADVERVIAWRNESTEGYGSTDQVIIVKLKNGYGLLTSWSDTSGHGCQCDASTNRADTLSSLLSHLTEDELVDLLRDRSNDDD